MTGMRRPPYSVLAVISRSVPRAPHLRNPRWCADRYQTFSSSSHESRPDDGELPRLPFRFDTGVALFAKRKPRPFPPPFLSPPSASFSDPLSTHDRSRDRRAFVDGELLRGSTNGDDAVYASDFFICANDGVGAWATRPRGHAGYVTETFYSGLADCKADYGHD